MTEAFGCTPFNTCVPHRVVPLDPHRAVYQLVLPVYGIQKSETRAVQLASDVLASHATNSRTRTGQFRFCNGKEISLLGRLDELGHVFIRLWVASS